MNLNAYRKSANGYFSPQLRARANRALQRAEFALLKTPHLMHKHVLSRIDAAYKNGSRSGLWSAWESVEEAVRAFSCFEGPAGLPMAADETSINKQAEQWSKDCEHMVRRVLGTLEQAGGPQSLKERHHAMLLLYSDCCSFTGLAKIEPPAISRTKDPDRAEREHASAIRRMKDERWWFRRIKRAHARWVEAIAQRNGFIGRNVGDPYVSSTTLQRYRAMRRSNRNVLDGLVAVCDDLDIEIPLLDAVDSSTANPVNRRNEMMTRLRGIEQWSTSRGMVGHFWTITCPSRFHRWTQDGLGNVTRNPNYDGSTPRDAQEYLRNVWSRVRAELSRQKIAIVGMRVAEPHHDGCPHWHALVFAAPGEIDVAADVMQRYALTDSPNEPGASTRRFVIETIDPEKGSATAYIAKYIAKHVDGTGTSLEGETDRESGLLFIQDEGERANNDRPEAIDRVCAWASVWGIRQFQFFRAGPVSAWRELRRLSKDDGSTGKLCEAWKAANAESFGGMGRSDWGDFLKAIDRHPVELIKEHQENSYGEQVPRIVGIMCGGRVYITHPHSWRIEQRRRTGSHGEDMGAWKWYYDKNGRYVGMSNCGIEPAGASGCTDVAPGHASQVFDEGEGQWVDSKSEGPKSATRAGTTHAGTSCRHKATHGDYCRQHAPS